MRNRFVGLVVVLALLVAVNILIVQNISNISQAASPQEIELERAMAVLQQHQQLSQRLNVLQGRQTVLEGLDSKADVVGVLGELSYLVGSGIVLENVVLEQRPFEASGQVKEYQLAGSLKAAVGDSVKPSRTRLTIVGIAISAGDVAEFIRRMEGSAYFTAVYPGYSRNQSITAAGSDKKIEVSEFEITCYLTNYKSGQTLAASVTGAEY